MIEIKGRALRNRRTEVGTADERGVININKFAKNNKYGARPLPSNVFFWNKKEKYC